MASKKFFVDIDLVKNALINAKIATVDALPESPVAGELCYYSNTLYYYNNTAWIPLSKDSKYAASSLVTDNTTNKEYAIYDSTASGATTTFKFRGVKAASAKIKLAHSGNNVTIDASISKSDVGLGNVDNTSDANKPVSTAQQNAIDTAVTNLNLGTAATKDTGNTAGKIPLIESSGKLSETILPALAITDTFTVETHAEMLALTGVQKGDVCVVSGENKTYILKQLPASTDSNWVLLKSPTADVTKSYVDQQDNSVKSELKGNVTTEYNTLGKIEAIVKSNKSTLQGSVDTINASKSNIYTTNVSTGNTVTISKATHKCGINPITQVYWNGQEVITDITLSSTGDLTFTWSNTNITTSNPLKIVIIGI